MDVTGLRDKVIARLEAMGEPVPPMTGLTVLGDTELLARELAVLVASGQKLATSSLAWEYEWERSCLPREGATDVVVDSEGTPFALIRTLSVEVVPFERAGSEFAYAEGEGDRTLESWRTEHWRFFSAVCAKIGRAPVHSMPIVCERFEVVRDLREIARRWR